MLRNPKLLDRILRAKSGTFSRELAREILGYRFPPSDHARYKRLSAKAQKGTLTSAEKAELDDYLNLNDFLVILKTKAEVSLRPSAA